MLFGFRSYGFKIWSKYRVFDSNSNGVLAKKQMFKEGKLCSTKCNGMFNSSCNIDHTPLSMPGFSDFEVNGRHLR